MYYVTMTDKFMSGWGHARGKINKLVFECESFQEALIVMENAENRTDQKHINYRDTKPYFSPKKYLVQIKTKADYPSWYKPGYFKRSQ